jgi:hypothetical protein
MRDEELLTPAGQVASAATDVVRRMNDRPGVWDFLEELKPLINLLELKARLAENEYSQTVTAAEEGKRLYLFARNVELANAIQAAKAALYEKAHGKKK